MIKSLPVATIVLGEKNSRAFESALGLVPDLQNITILSEHKAFEGHVPYTVTQDFLQAELEKAGLKADICVQKNTLRRKKLLICDMDSTLIGQECIDELADFAGVKDRVSAITERAMRGEIGFEGALKERVGLLKGLDLSILQRCFDERIHLNPGARTLCQTMKANGAKAVIVSGGFTFFTGKVAQACGFDAHQANTLIEEEGRLTGTVGMPIFGREGKLDFMKDYCNALGGPENAIAIGDGANDLAMITAAGLGVAYYAKPAVAAAAHCAINHSDLTATLFFQGYKEADFVR